jgi:CRISPR-associated endonuclease/helicase Cas3
MLGRKVMISSATIAPDLALGFFNAYQAGWHIFAKMRSKNLVDYHVNRYGWHVCMVM